VNRDTAPDLLTPARADSARVAEWGREVLEAEGRAILGLKERIGKEFERAIQLLLEVQGQVLTSGVGKSGLVAKKIAATLTSTGTPATFVHPVDAIHGDLGIVTDRDAALLLSKSGETPEILDLLPAFRRRGVPILTITGQPESTLARGSDCVLDLGRTREACPEDLVPTTSTTAALALGDALAIVLLRMKGFSREDFAFLAGLDVDILLLGTGPRQRFPHPRLTAPLAAARIGLEVMDLKAACRTYNILVAEERKVGLALLFE